jgi:hypothetical protein
MGGRSFIYQHISIYRAVMNLLYLGRYKRRFTPIIDQLKTLPGNAQILELCFGDLYIASFCKKAGYRWMGIDLNTYFVERARRLGYHAWSDDLSVTKTLPKADVCIMIGSLYHFHDNAFSMLEKMLNASDILVISEPVINFSSARGFIGSLAKRAANAGKGNEAFRYTASSLICLLEESSSLLGYRVAATQDLGKDLLIKIIKNGKN